MNDFFLLIKHFFIFNYKYDERLLKMAELNGDKLEQKTLVSLIKTIGAEAGEEAYKRFHVLYSEKHRKDFIGHDGILISTARKYYDDRARVFSRYASINYGVGRKPFKSNWNDYYNNLDDRVMM